MGVSWHKGRGKFIAFAPVFGYKLHLGYFVNKPDAIAAERQFWADFDASENRLLWALCRIYKTSEEAVLGHAIDALSEFGRERTNCTPIGYIIRRVGEKRATGECARDIKEARACVRACEARAYVWDYVFMGATWDDVRAEARVQYGDFREAVREICG